MDFSRVESYSDINKLVTQDLEAEFRQNSPGSNYIAESQDSTPKKSFLDESEKDDSEFNHSESLLGGLEGHDNDGCANRLISFPSNDNFDQMYQEASDSSPENSKSTGEPGSKSDSNKVTEDFAQNSSAEDLSEYVVENPDSISAAVSEFSSEPSEKGRTQRKGKFSKNYLRRDAIVKKTLRGLLHVIKAYFEPKVRNSPDEIKETLQNPEELKSFLANCILSDLGLVLAKNEVFECYGVIAYEIFGKQYYEDRLVEEDIEELVPKIEAFMMFNDSKLGRSRHRAYSLTHVVIKLGKFLYENGDASRRHFWQKLKDRKNLTIKDEKQLKMKVKGVLEEIEHGAIMDSS